MINKFINLAEQIVEEFEKQDLIITSTKDYEDNLENIALYLAAKEYLKRYA